MGKNKKSCVNVYLILAPTMHETTTMPSSLRLYAKEISTLDPNKP